MKRATWRCLRVESLEPRRVLTDVFNELGIVVVANSDAVAGAPAIPILRDGVFQENADQLVFSYDVDATDGFDSRQMLVIDSNGLMRLRHLDGDAAPGSEDNFGSNFKLPPQLRLESGDFLGARVTEMNVVTTRAHLGILELEMTGRPIDGGGSSPPVEVSWQMTILPSNYHRGWIRPAHAQSSVIVDVHVAFQGEVTLAQGATAQAEAFRVAEITSSNVPASNTGGLGRTHDADQLRVTSDDGSELAAVSLNDAPPNTLGFPSGIAFDGWLETNQLTEAPLNGDPPNVRVDVHSATGAPEHRAQFFITVNPGIDENSDNVGAFVSRTFDTANRTIGAGTEFSWTVRVDANDFPRGGLDSNLQYVRQLYLQELGRPGALVEVASWAQLLDGTIGSRIFVEQQIATSPEARARTLDHYYTHFLGRDADLFGLINWDQLLLQGGEEQVAAGILGSVEFFQRAQSQIGTGTQVERFVRALYQVLMNRDPAASEVNGWVSFLASGATRSQVGFLFLASVEYRDDVIRALYLTHLHRQPGDNEISLWSASTLDLRTARERIAASDEFFTRN